ISARAANQLSSTEKSELPEAELVVSEPTILLKPRFPDASLCDHVAGSGSTTVYVPAGNGTLGGWHSQFTLGFPPWPALGVTVQGPYTVPSLLRRLMPLPVDSDPFPSFQ